MPFPLLFLTLALAAGILFSSFLSFSLLTLISATTASLAFALIFFFFLRKMTPSLIFILITTFFLGSTLHTYSNQNFDDNSLHNWRATSYADFYGTLYKSPSRGRDRDFLYLKVKKVSYLNKEEKLNGNLRISLRQSPDFPTPPNLLVHDKIKVSAQLITFKNYRNFSPPSLNMYLKSQNIHNRAFAKSPLLLEKIEKGNKYSLLRWISLIRQKLQKKIEENFSSVSNTLSPQGAVLEALLLGERGRLDESISQALQNAGLFHLFAISGAHIAIISFFLFSLFKIIRIPVRSSYLLIMFFLVLYALLVEGRPSVLRATVMTLAFLFGKLIWKDVNLINTISISAFILLFINPLNLFALGFQLTFAATFSIILFFPKIIKYLPRLPLRISEIFTLSLTAHLGVLPIIANAFNRVTFSALILNYAALPLVGLIMICGYIFLPLSFVSPSIAQFLVKAINYSTDLLIGSSHLFDSVSFLSFRIPTPHMLTVIGYFLILLLFLFPSKIKRQKFIIALCFLGCLAVIIFYPFSSRSQNLKLTFIDVGQGESVLVEFPGREKMLIDGGGLFEGTFDIGERVVSPFLWKKGMKKIDFLVLTHPHPDHLNGLKSIVRNFQVGEFWEAFSPLENESYEKFKTLLPSDVPRKRIFRGYSNSVGNVRIEALHPKKGALNVPTVHNDQSIVLRLSYGQTSFLLTGDIGSEAENSILKDFKEIKSHILKSPHHGSNSSSSLLFLQRTMPRIVIISVGEKNKFGFPNQEVLERYKEIGAEVYRTDFHGAIEVSSDGHIINIRTSTGKTASYSISQ